MNYVLIVAKVTQFDLQFLNLNKLLFYIYKSYKNNHKNSFSYK